MEFSKNQPIYKQIIDHFCYRILEGKWTPEDRIPSVREIAMTMEVNPNTAMRAYHFLQEKGILMNKRGVGYYTAEDAYQKVLTLKREEFINDELPCFFRSIDLLGFSFHEIEQYYEKYKDHKLPDD